MRKFIFAGFVCIFLLVVICTAGCVSNSSAFSDPIVGTSDPIVGTWDPDRYSFDGISLMRDISNQYNRFVFKSDGTGTEYWYDDYTKENDTIYYSPNDLVKKFDLTWRANGTDNSGNKEYIISYNGYSSNFDDKCEISFSSHDKPKALSNEFYDYVPSTIGDIIEPGNTIISANNGEIEKKILGLWYRETSMTWIDSYNFEGDGTGTTISGLRDRNKKTYNFTWKWNPIQTGGGEGRGRIDYDNSQTYTYFELRDSQLIVGAIYGDGLTLNKII